MLLVVLVIAFVAIQISGASPQHHAPTPETPRTVVNANGTPSTMATHKIVFSKRLNGVSHIYSMNADGTLLAFEWDKNGNSQSDPNAYAEVWIMQADGTKQMSTGVQCSDVGCGPRWQP